MDTIRRILIAWITNIKSVSIVAGLALLWIIISGLNSSLHESCNNSNTKYHFLKEACINEGIRNNKILNDIFIILFIISLVVSILMAIFEEYK